MKKRLFLGLALIALLALALFLPLKKSFALKDLSTDNIVFVGDIKNYQNFYVEFVHSVNKTPVREYYEIMDQGFRLYKAQSFSYGAGMSDGTDIDNASLRADIDSSVVLDLDRYFDNIVYFVGTISNHKLVAKDSSVDFSAYVRSKKPIQISIDRINLYTYLKISSNQQGG